MSAYRDYLYRKMSGDGGGADLSGLTASVAQLRSDVDENALLLQETVLQVNLMDQEKAPRMVYVTGGTGSDITMALAGGTHWTFEQPLEGLTFSSIADSHDESVVDFAAGTAFNMIVPPGVKIMGKLIFEPGKDYVISVKDNWLVAGGEEDEV